MKIFGNPLCDKCKSRHSRSFDCQAEWDRQGSLTRALERTYKPPEPSMEERLRAAIRDIYGKATTYGTIEEAGEEWIGSYVIPASCLHRAIGLAGHACPVNDGTSAERLADDGVPQQTLESSSPEARIVPSAVLTLPCPFCGGAAALHECDWCEPHEWNAYCPACRAMTDTAATPAEAAGSWNLREEGRRAEARIVLLEEANKWRPIETATKSPGARVLLWFPWADGGGIEFIGTWAYPSEDAPGPAWVDPDDMEVLGDPTHWQPLPDPPGAALSSEGSPVPPKEEDSHG